MKRFLTALVASVAFLSIAAPSYADSMGANASKMVAPVMAVAKSCPKHYTYVKGYTKKNGTKVKGYCRKLK
jgi:Tfp pilus assembly protein PilE